MCQCQCYHPPFAGRRRSTQCQPWSNFDTRWYSSIKLADSSKSRVGQKKWQKSPFSDKSHLFKWLFEKNGFLAVSGSNLGLELVTSSLRQNSSWTCVSTSFSLPCINFQALIRTISWNRWKAIRTCLWTRQDLCSPLTGSDLIFAVSAYGMGKEGQKSSDLTGACLLPGLQSWPPQGWATSGQNVSLIHFLVKFFVVACRKMSI